MPPTHTDEGLRAAARIRAEHPGIAIMVLSAYVAEAYVPELLDATAGRAAGSATCSRTASATSASSSPASTGSRQARPWSTPRWSGSCSAAAADDGPLGSLTDREREVLALMAEGRTNGSIAEALVVSEAAVRKHVGNIFAKLDLDPASDRRVSAVLAYLRGLPPRAPASRACWRTPRGSGPRARVGTRRRGRGAR